MTLKQHTYCRICEAACGLEVERDPQGQPISLRPDKKHPLSQGFVCAKGLRFLETVQHPHRLLFPQQKQPDGSYQQVSWVEAMNHIQKVIYNLQQQYGPHSIALYFGTPLIHNTLGITAMFQLAQALGTRNFYSAGSQDNSNKLVA